MFEQNQRPILALCAGAGVLTLVTYALFSLVDRAVDKTEERKATTHLLVSTKTGYGTSGGAESVQESLLAEDARFLEEMKEADEDAAAKKAEAKGIASARDAAATNALNAAMSSPKSSSRKVDWKKEIVRDLLNEAYEMAAESDESEEAISFLLRIANYQDITSDEDGAALSLLKAEGKAMVINDQYAFSRDLANILKAEVEYGDLERALELSGNIPDEMHRSAVLMSVSEKLAKLGDMRAAKSTASTIPDSRWRATAFSLLAVRQAKRGDFDAANATAAMLPDASVRSRVLNRVAVTIARFHPWESAKETLAKIPNMEEKADAFAEIAATEARKGNFVNAENLLQLITDPAKKRRALFKIADAQSRLKAVHMAKLTAAQLSDPMERQRAIKTIAYGQARGGDYSGAVQTTKSIADSKLRNASFAAIATTRALKRDAFGARATARAIGDVKARETALRDIARMQARIGLIADGQASARMIVDPALRASAMTDLAVYQVRFGQRDDALSNLIDASSSAALIESEKPRNSALIKLAAAQARADQAFLAHGTVSRIGSIRDRLKAYRIVASNQAASGDFPGAIRTALGIQEPKQQHSAFIEIARFAGREAQVNEARQQLESLQSPEEKIQFVLSLAERHYPLSRYRKNDLVDPKDRSAKDREALARQLRG